MNRHESQLAQSTRTATRRLHRRAAHTVVVRAVSCAIPANAFEAAAQTIVGLAPAVVRDAAMLELLAAEVRIAELEKALAEACAAASTDPLTGALNRRGFDQAAQRELARARRNGGSYALVHIDLDDFKQLNDALGHQAGDAVLKHLVAVLQRSMRPTDVLCRFGGEEFVLLLPDTALAAATHVVSRFLRDFSAQDVPGTECRVTFSAGVVQPAPDENFDDAIRRADTATYAAKHAGKNRVIAG